MKCSNCADNGWVCENHPDRPWGDPADLPGGCRCGAGMPCAECNQSNADKPPRLPPDFEEFREEIRDKTNDRYDEYVRRQRVIDSLKKEPDRGS